MAGQHRHLTAEKEPGQHECARLQKRHGDLDTHSRLGVLWPDGQQEQSWQKHEAIASAHLLCGLLARASAPMKNTMAAAVPASGMSQLKSVVHFLHSWPAQAHTSRYISCSSTTPVMNYPERHARTPRVVAHVADGADGAQVAARDGKQASKPLPERACKAHRRACCAAHAPWQAGLIAGIRPRLAGGAHRARKQQR